MEKFWWKSKIRKQIFRYAVWEPIFTVYIGPFYTNRAVPCGWKEAGACSAGVGAMKISGAVVAWLVLVPLAMLCYYLTVLLPQIRATEWEEGRLQSVLLEMGTNMVGVNDFLLTHLLAYYSLGLLRYVCTERTTSSFL
jgi:hypothetical protein